MHVPVLAENKPHGGTAVVCLAAGIGAMVLAAFFYRRGRLGLTLGGRKAMHPMKRWALKWYYGIALGAAGFALVVLSIIGIVT